MRRKNNIKARREMNRENRDINRIAAAGIPVDWRLECDDQSELAILAAEKEGGLPKFAMTAYTGVPMTTFFGRVVVDLAGIKTSNRMPILWGHDPDKPIAHAERIDKSNGKLVASGLVSGADEYASKFVGMSKNGFPFQASIGATVEKVVRLEEGKTAVVNGKEVVGPLMIAKRSTLREISVVVNGADSNTDSRVVAQMQIEKEMNMEFEKWLEEKGIKAEGLAPEVLAALKAAYEGEIEAGEIEKPEPKAEPEKIEAEDGVKALRAEADRIAKIEAATVPGADAPEEVRTKLADIRAKAIAEGWIVEKAQLESLRASRVNVAPAVHSSKNEIGRDVLICAAAMQGGIKGDALLPDMGDKTVHAADKFRRMGLRDMIHAAARLDGVELPSDSRSSDWIRAAFSSNAVSGIVGDSATKVLLGAYQAQPSVARRVAATKPLANFHAHTMYRMTGDFELEKANANNELPAGTLDEESSSIQADTYGKMFQLTRQMIINDDLGAFLDIPRRIGQGAALALEKVYFTALLANASSFFGSGNSNYISGATSVLSNTSLGTAVQTFLGQTDGDGNPISVMPKFLLVPPALYITALELFKSTTLVPTGLASTSAAKRDAGTNVHAGSYEPIVSPWLSTATLTGYSTTAWYLLDPEFSAIGFVNGADMPTVEQVDLAPNTLGLGWRVYFDFGVGLVDHRLAVKSAGA